MRRVPVFLVISVLLPVISAAQTLIPPFRALELTEDQQGQIRTIVEKARETRLKLTTDLQRERYRLHDLIVSPELDTRAAGQSYGRVLQLGQQILKVVADAFEKQEGVLTAAQRDGLAVKWAPKPPQVIPTPGEEPWTWGVKCEKTPKSAVMFMVCTSVRNPNKWWVVWRDGSISPYHDPGDPMNEP